MTRIEEVTRQKLNTAEAELAALQREIRYLSERGLTTDGVQHKQHFLSQIALCVGVPAETIEDRGVAP